MLDGEPTLEDVVRIAARYGISPIAAVFRLGTLRLSRRIDALRREIDDGLATDVWRHLALPPFADEIAAIGRDDLPRLSPAIAGGALAAIAAGRTSIADAASAADCAPERLASGAATIGVLRPRAAEEEAVELVHRRGAEASAARESASMSWTIQSSASSSARKNAWLGAAGAGGDGSAMRTPPSVSDSASTSRRDRRPASSSPRSSRSR